MEIWPDHRRKIRKDDVLYQQMKRNGTCGGGERREESEKRKLDAKN